MPTRLDRLLTLALLALLPVLCVLTDNNFYKSMLVFGIISSISATGLCLMLGLGGQISLGQAAFFGIGAYVTANLDGKLGVEPILAIIAGALVSMATGWAISRPLSRLHDHYLAMATLAFGTMMYIAFANGRALTGGLDPGMSVPKFTILGREFGSMNELFVLTWIGLAASVLLASNIAGNRIGRSLRAMKMSPAGAASVGIDVVRAKAFVFAVSALLTGFAGGLYAYAARSFNAGVFGVGYSIELLMMVVIGSLNRVSGAIAGAFIITALPMIFEHFEDYRTLVFGVTMVLIMKFMPSGLVDGLFGLRARFTAARRD
ncbi:MAG TPA: branched-chain amino acid ABC transporter permease [Burkholderiaceae bacterium]|nr:branched-chain amino acid ABC transporter permease [Burkholderiaceae bacterium]